MLNRSASLAMSTSVLEAMPGKLDIKRHSPSILYISASLVMSLSVLKALPSKLDIKRHSPSSLYSSCLTLIPSQIVQMHISLSLKERCSLMSAFTICCFYEAVKDQNIKMRPDRNTSSTCRQRNLYFQNLLFSQMKCCSKSVIIFFFDFFFLGGGWGGA